METFTMNTPACLLACGCWVRRRLDYATYNAVDSCNEHGETTIVKVNFNEYHVRCGYPGCRFGRWLGQSQELALQAQRRHKAAHPKHLPSVAWDRVTWDGVGSVFREEVDRLTPARKPKPPPVVEVMLDLDGEPPF